MSARAIIIKGPTPESKSYFTAVPNTLEELVQKATKLFPLPPNHAGHLLTDNDAILMPDVLPFLRDREVLTFRWCTGTPRSSMRQPTRSSEDPMRSTSQAINGNNFYRDSVDGSGGSTGSRTSRGVRFDASVQSKEIASAKEFTYSSKVRAEHTRRVLSAQDEQRRAETGSTGTPTSAEMFKSNSLDAESMSKQARTEQRVAYAEAQEATEAASKAPAPTSNNSEPMRSPDNNIGSSPRTTSTAVQNVAPQTNPFEEQQNSSPIASPTRDIRGAQKSNKEWMTPLGSESRTDVVPTAPAGGEEDEAVMVEAGKVVEAPAVKAVERTVEKEQPLATVAEQAAADANEQPSDPVVEASQDVPAPVTDKPESPAPQRTRSTRNQIEYQRMTSVIEALFGHPSNNHFRHPIDPSTSKGSVTIAFLHDNDLPVVDFSTISDKLRRGEYGNEDPFVGFTDDLGRMWSNARLMYGQQSAEAQCADFLERFSRVIMVEWRKESDGRMRRQECEESAGDASRRREQAMARAAKLIQSMSFGNGMKKPKAVAGSLDRAASKTGREEQLVLGQQTKPRSASLQLQQQQKQKKTSPRPTLPGAKSSDKLDHSNFTPQTQAFLATMFQKGNSKAQPTSASADMMAKLQRQFGSTSPVGARDTSSPKAPTLPRNGAKTDAPIGRGAKRSAEASPNAKSTESRPAKKVDVGKDDVVQQAAAKTVPVVMITDDDDAPAAQKTPRAVALAVADEESAVEEAIGLASTSTSPSRSAEGSPCRTSQNSSPAGKKQTVRAAASQDKFAHGIVSRRTSTRNRRPAKMTA